MTFRYLQSRKRKFHRRQMLLSCCGPSKHCNCDDHFQPVLTDQGICFSFNPISLNKSFKETNYTSMFNAFFQNYDRDSCDSDNSNFEMHITLDSHKSKVDTVLRLSFCFINDDLTVNIISRHHKSNREDILLLQSIREMSL